MSQLPHIAKWFEGASAPGTELPGLGERRGEARARFEALGLPTPKWEGWKYTKLSALSDVAFEPDPAARALARVDAAALAALELPALGDAATRLVFVNGRYAEHLSRAGDGRAVALSRAGAAHEPVLAAHLGRLAAFDEHPLCALNTALAREGALVVARRGAAAAAPIHLLFVAAAEPGEAVAAWPRVLVVAEDGAQATVVEQWVSLGAGQTFTNAVVELALAQGAHVEHCRLQDEGAGGHHVARTEVVQARGSVLRHHAFTFGGGLTRSELSVRLAGEGAEALLNGLYVQGSGQHSDTDTLVDHAAPGCTSRERYKGVMDGRGRGVFTGRIIVRPGAQKTDASQQNRNLLLSRQAFADARPQLEINADDVKCSHGATIGRLDPDALFYLRSRALPEETARRMLTYGFAAEVVDDVGLRPVADLVRARLRGPLAGIDVEAAR